MRRLLLLALIISFFLSCSSDDTSIELNNRIETTSFEITTPGGWRLIEEQGYDSYAGRFEYEEKIIFFDQGYLSTGDLSNIQETDQTAYFQSLEIDGVPAIIRKEYFTNSSSTNSVLSVLLDDGERQNRLYVRDSDQDEVYIAIFKTHKFRN